MFDSDAFVAACVDANKEGESRGAVTDVLRKAMDTPGDVAEGLGDVAPGITVLHGSPDLTVLNVVWAPHMQLPPHDHRMWAAIGIYGGREDNAMYRRAAPDSKTLTEAGGKQLDEGDVLLLGTDAIHGVTNPLDRLTGAIHIYGGDFVNEPRSQWGPGERVEQPYDLDYIRSLFEEASSQRRP